MKKPNWIKACEDTQKKLEIYLGDMDVFWFDVKVEGVKNPDNCSFCEQSDNGCVSCIVFDACHARDRFTSDFYNKDDRISEVRKCQEYLEELKGKLERGEL